MLSGLVSVVPAVSGVMVDVAAGSAMLLDMELVSAKAVGNVVAIERVVNSAAKASDDFFMITFLVQV